MHGLKMLRDSMRFGFGMSRRDFCGGILARAPESTLSTPPPPGVRLERDRGPNTLNREPKVRPAAGEPCVREPSPPPPVQASAQGQAFRHIELDRGKASRDSAVSCRPGSRSQSWWLGLGVGASAMGNLYGCARHSALSRAAASLILAREMLPRISPCPPDQLSSFAPLFFLSAPPPAGAPPRLNVEP